MDIEEANLLTNESASMIEAEPMSVFSLAKAFRAFKPQKAEYAVAIKTNRTNIVMGLSCGGFRPQSVNHVTWRRLVELIAAFSFRELVLPLQLPAKLTKALADFNVHHVDCSELLRKRVQSSLRFSNLGRGIRLREHSSNSLDRVGCLPARTYSCARQPHGRANLCKIHSPTPLLPACIAATVDRLTVMTQVPGVGLDLQGAQGTGGGTVAQEIHQISFADQEDAA